MDICHRVDDIVWSESAKVWDDTFSLLLAERPNIGVLVNVVMKWLFCQFEEFKVKYLKVSQILAGMRESLFQDLHYGVERLSRHYNFIAMRYELAYNACKAMEYF